MEAAWRNQRDCTSLCQDCPGRCAPYPLGGLGDPRSEIMLVGQDPAYNLDVDRVDEKQENLNWEEARAQMVEDRRRENNPLWKVMCTVAQAADLEDPTNLYFTNLVRCDDKNSEGSAWAARRDRCRGYFLRELEHVSPAYILLFGKKVMKTVLQMHGGNEPPSTMENGHQEEFKILDRTCLSFYHWGYVNYGGSPYEDFDEYEEELNHSVGTLIS